ncbi:hypothetical protein AC1031_020464 [Aphanomyces cochlioides]|nr:hypothetical protein AC1031_020464 [Aphanomyces cochlioides]
MLTLFCIVVGEGEPFAVEIAASKAVALLMDKVLEKKSKSIHCDANKLKLYLAKTPDGTWLDINDAKDVALDEDGNLQHYDMMNPTHFINRYFNATDVAEERIHVLVVVPDGQFGPATGKRSIEDIGEIVEASVYKAMRDSAEKVSVHSLSTMDSPKKHLLRKMALKVTVVGVKEPSDKSIPAFKWNDELDENQENQRAQYMAYLETHLTTLLDEFTLKDIAINKSILNTVDPRLPFDINGTADVLLVVKSKASNVIQLSGLCLVINLKKKVASEHVNLSRWPACVREHQGPTRVLSDEFVDRFERHLVFLLFQ